MDPMFKKQIEELRKVGREADKLDKQRAELFEGLTKHPGWDVYQDLLNSRIQTYADAVMAPAGTVDGAVALEWVKGAMSGLIMARDLPSVTINAMQPAVPATDGDEQ